MRAKHPGARLTIVGCSPQISEPGCEVVGRIEPERVTEFYQRASLYCLPTKLEAFGISYIEAMHHALPVVGTDMGAIHDGYASLTPLHLDLTHHAALARMSDWEGALSAQLKRDAARRR